MMRKIDWLREKGVDVRNGMDRCFGRESFYLNLVEKMLGDEKFDAIVRAQAAGDRGSVLNMARALQETSGNLSLTPLVNAIGRLCDDLEKGADAETTAVAVRDVLEIRGSLQRTGDGE